VLNQSNMVKDGLNSTFVYNFPNSMTFSHHEISIQSVSMFYSWSNISSTLGNNKFTFYYPVNSAGAVSSGAAQLNTYVVTIPTGQWDIPSINKLLQYTCIQNGLYLINSSGQNVYFLEMLVNANRYAIQCNTFPMPTSVGWTWSAVTGIWTGNTGTAYAGWTTPVASVSAGIASFAGFPSAVTQYNPCFYFPASFSSIVGYPVNTYTIGDTTTYLNGQVLATPPTISTVDQAGLNRSYISSVAPQVQPNSSIYFSISNIDNRYATPNSIIFSLNPSVAFGLQISEYPPQFSWNKMLTGTYNQIRLQILGLNYAPLQIQDPNMTVVLLIRSTRDEGSIFAALENAQGGK